MRKLWRALHKIYCSSVGAHYVFHQARRLTNVLFTTIFLDPASPLMIRNGCTSLTVVTRRLQPLSAGVRLASTASAENASSSKPIPPPRATSKPRSTFSKGDYKSRRFEGTRDGEQEAPKRLLKPYQVSARVHKMCGEGNIEDAVKYVQSMPLDALNIVVWNTLISQAGHVKRFRLAHEVYTDVSCFTPQYIIDTASRQSGHNAKA